MARIDTPLSLLDRLCRHDDAEAWRQFSILYEPLIRQWVGRLVSPSAAVDDAVQEVLAAMIEGLPTSGISPNAVYIAKARVLKRLRLEARGLIE